MRRARDGGDRGCGHRAMDQAQAERARPRGGGGRAAAGAPAAARPREPQRAPGQRRGLAARERRQSGREPVRRTPRGRATKRRNSWRGRTRRGWTCRRGRTRRWRARRTRTRRRRSGGGHQWTSSASLAEPVDRFSEDSPGPKSNSDDITCRRGVSLVLFPHVPYLLFAPGALRSGEESPRSM